MGEPEGGSASPLGTWSGRLAGPTSKNARP